MGVGSEQGGHNPSIGGAVDFDELALNDDGLIVCGLVTPLIIYQLFFHALSFVVGNTTACHSFGADTVS